MSWVVVTDEVFFFSSRRRHTRFTSDWSSDVCSSDLLVFEIIAVVVDPVPVKLWVALLLAPLLKNS